MEILFHKLKGRGVIMSSGKEIDWHLHFGHMVYEGSVNHIVHHVPGRK